MSDNTPEPIPNPLWKQDDFLLAIWKHCNTMNSELGKVMTDIKWLKWLVCAIFLFLLGLYAKLQS